MEEKEIKNNMQALLNIVSLNYGNKGSLFIYTDDFEKWYNESMPLNIKDGYKTFEDFLKWRLECG
jgi:hypothetical protein